MEAALSHLKGSMKRGLALVATKKREMKAPNSTQSSLAVTHPSTNVVP